MSNRNLGLVRGSLLSGAFLAVISVVTLWSTIARATITQGDFSVFGFLESREAGRWGEGSKTGGTPTTFAPLSPTLSAAFLGRAASPGGGAYDFNHWDVSEIRQLASIRPDYHIVKNYNFLGRLDTVFLKDADVFAIYRPWYDAFGTLKDRGRAEASRDWNLVEYNQTQLQQKYFQNNLHEYYAQLNWTDNFSMRVGKQQVIWSEADALSGTEITNPVNFSYHWTNFESPEDARQNLRMVKFNYILPDVFHTSDNQIEAFVIPGDYEGDGTTGIFATDPRDPYDLVLPQGGTPAINAATGTGLKGGAHNPTFGEGFNLEGQPYNDRTIPDNGNFPMAAVGGPALGIPVPGSDFFFDEVVNSPGSISPYNKNPGIAHLPSNSLQNSEFGARISTLLPIGNGLQTSFIFLYQNRGNAFNFCTTCAAPPGSVKLDTGIFLQPGAAPVFGAHGNKAVLGNLFVDVTENFRRRSFYGITGTYYDKDLTDVVFRYDALYAPSVGVEILPAISGGCGTCKTGQLGMTNTSRARFIIAGDRPTYIPWLSKQHTFLTAQYVATDYPNLPANTIMGPGDAAGKVRRLSSFAFLSAVNWLINGQLTTTNVVAWDVDDTVGFVESSNVFRYSRNVLFGINAIEYLGRSGRMTDPFIFSGNQRFTQELEFTLTYEI